MSSEPHNKNPVQVVLNAKHYIEAQNKPPGGSNKDFFANNDRGFAEHKAKLVQQVSAVRERVVGSAFGETAYVKVSLRENAWAKSHRPTRKLFQPSYFPPAGADGIGVLYFEVSADTVPLLLRTINEAEPETRSRVNEKTEKIEITPSRQRSEIGAIQSINLPDDTDKRSFSVQEALKWITSERAGRLYLIDIFNLTATKGDLIDLPEHTQAIYESLVDGLNKLPFGVLIFRSSLSKNSSHSYLFLRPIKEKVNLTTADLFNYWTPQFGQLTFDSSEIDHDQLIRYLSKHPLVRRILLPPIIQGAQSVADLTPKKGKMPAKADGNKYPRVGVVDSGISKNYSPWVLSSVETIAPVHRREAHGTFIAGLLVAAREAGNAVEVAPESDGCEIVDLAIFPNHEISDLFDTYYPNGFEDFLLELDSAVGLAKQRHGVRIYNLSINVEQEVNEDRYGPFAELIDIIAERHDVIIVISAGNLNNKRFRAPWPSLPNEVAGHLLPHAADDRIFQPAESIYAISVGALNPPGVAGQLAGAPARYTRRGPGMSVGVKPDFAHYGGACPGGKTIDSGLYSINGLGDIGSGMGTSFAAPLVAKTLACLESRIQGYVTRHTLTALLVHNATLPRVLDHDELRTIARTFVGFGLPSSADEILLNDPNSITMVFDSEITQGRELRFPFSWPQSLVGENGKCRGTATLTLVYKPTLDSSCGAEFIRLNLDGHLRQDDGKGNFRSRTKQIFMKGAEGDAHFEADLIDNGLKWWPTKHYRFHSTRGTGKSSEWRLVVEPLLRDGAIFPLKGVAFTAIVTISDTDVDNPLFDEMRLWLQTNNVQCTDIRSAVQIRPTITGS